jgi:hypothetical protein
MTLENGWPTVWIVRCYFSSALIEAENERKIFSHIEQYPVRMRAHRRQYHGDNERTLTIRRVGRAYEL